MTDDKTTEVVFKRGRFHERVDGKFIPRAIVVWLKHNPSFIEIPKGYVIHHLDYDRLNDDITNLCLMYKTHHVAHHWKNINKKVVVKVDSGMRNRFYPTRKPVYCYHPPAKRFYISFGERSEEHGKVERKKLWKNFAGKPMFTEEDAKEFAEAMWAEARDSSNLTPLGITG